MSARETAVRLFAHATMVVGAIFVVTVLLAAMPGHNAPSVQAVGLQEPRNSQGSSSATPPEAGMDHSRMNLDMGDDKENEKAAISEMNDMHGSSSPHLHMTETRAQNVRDLQ